MQLNSKNKSIKIKVMFLYSFGKGCYRILFDTVHRCCCDRFSKEETGQQMDKRRLGEDPNRKCWEGKERRQRSEQMQKETRWTCCIENRYQNILQTIDKNRA